MFKVTNSKNRYQLQGRNHVSTKKVRQSFATLQSLLLYRITSYKEINDSHEYLNFILEPNNERKL